ncbi:AAA family ATPase [Halorussus ruber]|uniref:AAA family ATPase n=1 Tax=Halorussus ruber TaxID=1126238 RepID=UPI0010926860|nr:MoxR family ATPase [Halorussus ruber]
MTYWWVNTNKRHLPDDGRKPLHEGFVSTYGDKDRFPQRATEGDKVFSFLNGAGIIGYGTIRTGEYTTATDPDSRVYEREHTEYHLPVAWHYLLDSDNAISSATAAEKLGYDGPSFDSTYRKIDSGTPKALVEEIRARARTIDRPTPDQSRPHVESEGYYFDLPAIQSALWLFGELKADPTPEEAVLAAEGLVEYFCNWGPYRGTTHNDHGTSMDFTTDEAEDLVDTWSSEISIALEERCGVDVAPDTIAALGRELGLGTFPDLTADYLLNHLWDVSAHLHAIDPDHEEGPRDVVSVYDDLYDELPADFCAYWRNKDTEESPINEIRVKALDRHASNRLTKRAYEKDEQEVNQQYDRNITNGWRPYAILGGVYYDLLKPRLRHHFDSLCEELLTLADGENLETHVVDYMGSMQKLGNFGWCCVYPKPEEGESHKDHYQLYLGINHNYVQYGLNIGKDLRTSDWRSIRDLTRVDRPNEVLRWDRVETKLELVKPKFDRLNEFGPGEREDEDTKLDVTATPEIDVSPETIDGLHFPETMAISLDGLLQQIEAALNAGNHIVFTGPPGTGKTELAEQVATHLADEYDVYTGTHLTTATADWSTFETIGGYMPSREGDRELKFQPGQLLRRFKQDGRQRNDVTVIDEINRSDIDKAFGQLFTVLSGQHVQLPYETKQENEILVRPAQAEDAPTDGDEDDDSSESGGTDLPLEEFIVPDSWRLLATMNSYDKTSLYDMSYAFMRRFTFIRVGAPEIPDAEDAAPTPEEFIAGYLAEWEDIDLEPQSPVVAGVLSAWRIMNEDEHARSLGPAIAEDMLGYVAGLPRATKEQRNRAVADAVVAYAFPQMEGMLDRRRDDVIEKLASLSRVSTERIETAAKEQFRG